MASIAFVYGHELGGSLGTQLDGIHHMIESGFNKDRLPAERILLGIVWFWGLFFLFRRFESWITAKFGWLLLTFGMNSLYVYTISAFVVFFIHLIIAPPGFYNLLLNLLASIIALGLVYLAVQTKFLMKIIPR